MQMVKRQLIAAISVMQQTQTNTPKTFFCIEGSQSRAITAKSCLPGRCIA